MPNDDITFLSDHQHSSCVNDILSSTKTSIRLFHKAIRVDSSSMPWLRYKADKQLCSEIMELAIRERATAVIFLSASSTMILALKHLLNRRTLRVPVLIIPHAVLVGIEGGEKYFWNRPIGIRAALHLPSPPNLHFIALSRTILRNAQPAFPNNYWHLMDHPYLFTENTPNANSTHTDGPGKVVIGIFGALRARLADYVAITKEVSRLPGVELTLIGHIAQQSPAAQELKKVLSCQYNRALDRSSYDTLGRAAHYSLNISDPIYHRYAASASLLDSFNFGAPVLALDNELLEEYQALMGPIGASCSSLSALIELVRCLPDHFTSYGYQQQVQMIMDRRVRFAPKLLYSTLRVILGDIQ
jgi:hypothetical protein